MAKFIPCEDSEATHVQILPTDGGNCELLNVIPYAIYEILLNDEPGFEGEEMLENEVGDYCASFSVVVNVRYMKEAGDCRK